MHGGGLPHPDLFSPVALNLSHSHHFSRFLVTDFHSMQLVTLGRLQILAAGPFRKGRRGHLINAFGHFVTVLVGRNYKMGIQSRYFTRRKPGSCAESRKPLHRQLQLQLHLESLEQRIVFNNYWVTNLADSGSGSLRAAIEAANTNPGMDTIRFNNSLQGTISLDSQLEISDSLNIRANPANKIIVSGQGSTRVFRIAAETDVTMRNLTIAKGYTEDAQGGAGILNAGNLHLIDSVVNGNEASNPESPTGRGGGINSSGNLTLDRTHVTGNKATRDGGGILHSAGNLILRNSTVSGNHAAADGAGITSEQGTVVSINRSEISDNVATGFGTGGIAAGGQLTITNSKITRNNSAAAGIYLMLGATGDVLISRSEISHNTIGDRSFGAAGIWSFSGRPMTIERTTIENNQGSAIYSPFGSSLLIRSSTISKNSGGFSTAFISGQSRIENSTISHNQSRSAGGVDNSGNLTIDSSTISDNRGGGVGGINSFGALTLNASTVSGNVSTPTGGHGGGGILGRATLINSTISGNTLDASNMVFDSPYASYEPTVAGGWLVTGEGNSVVSSTITGSRVINAPDKSILRSAGGVNTMDIEFSFYGYYDPETLYEYSYPADVAPRNTIIARNEVNGSQDDVAGTFISGGHNLIGVLTSDASGFVESDLRGSVSSPLDPKLGPLAFNGGKTKTHVPLRNSPAINAGDNAEATIADQRGFQRITRGRIDIGSVETSSWRVRVDFAFDQPTNTDSPVAVVVSQDRPGDRPVVKSMSGKVEANARSARNFDLVDRALKSLSQPSTQPRLPSAFDWDIDWLMMSAKASIG